MNLGPPWREVEGGVEIAVRLTPRGGTARIEGIAEWDGRPVLAVRVPAPPVEGAANDALVAFLAKSLGIRRSAVILIAGEGARLKRLRLDGPDLPQRLSGLVPSPK